MGRQGNTLRYHCGFEGVNYMQSRFHTEKDFNHWIQAGNPCETPLQGCVPFLFCLAHLPT